MAVAVYPYGPLSQPPPPRPPVLNIVVSSNRPLTDTVTSRRQDQHLPEGAPDGETSPSDEELENEPESIFAATNDSGWTGGFAYRPESQATGTLSDPLISAPVDPTYTDPAMVQFVPYVIQVQDSASAFGWSQRDYKARALRLLDNATPNAIETEFWNGTRAIASSWPNNFLTNHGTNAGPGGASVPFVDLTPAGTAPSVTRGLAILEDYLANTTATNTNPAGIYAGIGAQGMIHCMPQTAPSLLGARRVGNLLLSVMDNIILPASGYSGIDALVGTPSSTTSVMYATDIPMVLLDEPFVYPSTLADALDRSQNVVRYRARRFAAACFDNLRHAACRVTLGT
jgi:hypothetical protein